MKRYPALILLVLLISCTGADDYSRIESPAHMSGYGVIQIKDLSHDGQAKEDYKTSGLIRAQDSSIKLFVESNHIEDEIFDWDPDEDVVLGFEGYSGIKRITIFMDDHLMDDFIVNFDFMGDAYILADTKILEDKHYGNYSAKVYGCNDKKVSSFLSEIVGYKIDNNFEYIYLDEYSIFNGIERACDEYEEELEFSLFAQREEDKIPEITGYSTAHSKECCTMDYKAELMSNPNIEELKRCGIYDEYLNFRDAKDPETASCFLLSEGIAGYPSKRKSFLNYPCSGEDSISGARKHAIWMHDTCSPESSPDKKKGLVVPIIIYTLFFLALLAALLAKLRTHPITSTIIASAIYVTGIVILVGIVGSPAILSEQSYCNICPGTHLEVFLEQKKAYGEACDLLYPSIYRGFQDIDRLGFTNFPVSGSAAVCKPMSEMVNYYFSNSRYTGYADQSSCSSESIPSNLKGGYCFQSQCSSLKDIGLEHLKSKIYSIFRTTSRGVYYLPITILGQHKEYLKILRDLLYGETDNIALLSKSGDGHMIFSTKCLKNGDIEYYEPNTDNTATLSIDKKLHYKKKISNILGDEYELARVIEPEHQPLDKCR